ncbi:hypothetical protein C8F01DRAFT_1083911 [Mycena amicta]|nr:hypothetical protein C8F01DRAFT_1083911 [Mycena amicta]
MVLGPKSWRLPKLSSVRKSLSKIGISQSSSKRTAPSKQYVLRPENINLSKQNDAHLLRGGEYVLFGNQTLECWNVVENRLVWEYEKPDQDWRVGRFSQDVLPGGNAANVILYLLKWLDDAWTENRVDIIYLDLRAGSSTTLLSSQYPTLNHSNLSDAGICGSLAFASLNCYDPGDGSFKTTVHTLFDLQTATPKLYLKLVSNVEFLVALTSEHIIFLVDPPNHDGPELRILSVAAVKSTGYWSDQLNTEHHDSIDIAQLPTVIVSKISLKHSASWRPPWRRELHVHQSPLDDGTYRVWVRWGGFRVDGTQAGTLAGYHLFVTGSSDETASAALRPRIESPVGNGVSYFGHALQQIRQNQYQVYVPGKTKPVALLELPGVGP